jgi:hypothetical protein
MIGSNYFTGENVMLTLKPLVLLFILCFVVGIAEGQIAPQQGTGLHETGKNFEFLLASNGDLFAIKKSSTGTHSTEVHILSASSGYKNFSLQTGTALHETDDTFTFLLAPNRDIFTIKKRNTGTHKTEVHVLSASNSYQSFILQTGTALHETDNSFDFLLASNRDIFAIKKSNTGTHKTEIHMLSASSNYQNFSLQTGTALHETDDSFDFVIAPNRDVFAVKKRNTGTHSTEVHILSASSNYQNYSLQTGTALHETDDSFDFILADNRDLYAIKKGGTGTHSTEIHILSASSNYGKFGITPNLTENSDSGDGPSTLICLAWKTNLVYWQAEGALRLGKSQGRINNKAQCYHIADSAAELSKFLTEGDAVISALTDSCAKCACNSIF